MRAFVLTGPGESTGPGGADPVAGPGEVVVDVAPGRYLRHRRGVLHRRDGLPPRRATRTTRCASVTSGRARSSAVGAGVDASLARPSRHGRHHARLRRAAGGAGRAASTSASTGYEIGIRGDCPGALAEQLLVPVTALHRAAGQRRRRRRRDGRAGRQRASAPSRPRPSTPGERLLVLGPGTIGLLAALFARAARGRGAPAGRGRAVARVRPRSGSQDVWHARRRSPTCPSTRSSTPPTRRRSPPGPLDSSSPAGRVVLHRPVRRRRAWSTPATSPCKDVTAVGILGASPGLAGTIERVRRRVRRPAPAGRRHGRPGPRSATALAGPGRAGAGPGPKIHVDPRR